MIRRLFFAASAASLLICVATCGLWVRSWRIYDRCEIGFARQTHWPSRGYLFGVESSLHRLRLAATSYSDHEETALDDRAAIPRWLFRASHSHESQYPLELDHGDGGEFQLQQRGYASESQTMVGPRSVILRTTFILPHWFVIVATLPLPLLSATWMIRRRLTQSAGHCPSCGYDLRASRERCPECGMLLVDKRTK